MLPSPSAPGSRFRRRRLASRSVTLEGGTPGADAAGLSVVITPTGGLNAAGLSADAQATGEVRITAAGDLEMMGRIVSGATLIESGGTTTFDWSGATRRASDVTLVATGRAYLGGNTVNSVGDPITVGGFIHSARSITLAGGTHASGTGLLIHPNSELSTHGAAGSIDLTSQQDAEVRGRIASGGEIVQGVVTLFDGEATVRIEAAHQVRISREVAASQGVTIIGGIDPIEADPLSGHSVVVAGTGLLRTSAANAVVEIRGPQSITLLSPLDLTAYNVQAPGAGSRITIASGDRLTIGGRLQSYRDITLNGLSPTTGDPTEGSTVELTETSLLETINGSITFDAGSSGLVRGSLTAGGTGSDITIHGAANDLAIQGHLKAANAIVLNIPGDLDVSGDLLAGNRIALTAGGVLTLRSTSDVATTAAHAVVALTAQGTILLDGAVGGHATASTNDPAAMPYAAESLSTTTVESQAGNVTLTAASGRLQAGAALTVQGGLIELAGVVRTTSATAAPGSFDVLFDSRGLLQITGDIDVAGSLLAMSPTLVTVSDGTLRVSGNHRLRIEAPQVTVGTADAGGMVASGGSLEIAATDVGLRSGTQLLATGNNSLVRIDADYLDVAGSIRAGADLNTASALVWTGTSADVDLHVREMLTLTGSIRATGAIDIAVLGGSAAVGYSSGAFSTVQTDATGSGALTATNPSSITIITDRDLHLDGSVLASDDGADISLDVGKLLKIDGFVQADDALRLSAGEDQSSLSIYLRGTLNTGIGGSITLTAPKQILLEGAIGQYRPEGNNAVIDVGSVTITTSAALDVRGPLLAQHQVDLAATQINVLSSGVIRVSNTDGKVEARAVENLLVAAGGQVLSSGSIHLFGTNVRVNGIVENDNGSETPRVLLNAVESVVVAGTVTSKGDLHLNAGVGAAWSLAQLTGAIASADLTGGLVRVEGAGKLSATGTVKAAAGEDIELQADPEAPGVQRPVLTPTLSMLPQTIDVVVGHRQVAAGVVYTPLVRWVDTRVEMQTGVEQVKSGNYFHTMDVTLTQDGYYNGVTKREYFIHGIDYANSLAEQQNNAPVIDWAGDAPAAGATFNQLSDAQRAIVLAALGYLPLFDFSYANAQEHRTQQGSTSVVPWTPYWSTAASHIVQMALPGLEGKYIRLPIDAELDLVRVVTQGVPTTSTETVGSFSETAVVRYDQDRSRYTGFDDLDRSAERFAVSYVGDGRRTYTVIDGSGGTVNTPPVWGTSVDTEVGVDALGKLVLAPLGFLPTTASLTSLGLVLVRPDQRVIDPSTNLRLQFEPDAKTIYDFVPYPSIPLASGFRTAAPADAALRGGQVAVILSAEDNYWADQASPDDQLVLLGFYAYPTDGINYFIAFYDQTRITYTNWAPGQPDQLNAAGSAGEFDVVTIGASGLWYDIVNFATGGMINSGYLLQRSAVETFYDYTFDWTSQAHVVQDTRLTLGYQWVSNTHDLFTEVPVVELVDAKVAVVDQVPSTSWVAQPITEQQTVLRPTRVMVPGAATEVAVFSGDSLASESAIVLDAGRDVTLSGLVTAKNAAGTAGAISIDAGRNFYMTGAKPAGADETMQAATAGMSAVSRIAITAAGTFTLAESISITAADENAADSTSNAIVVTAGDSAIIRGTLSTTNTRIGEVTVRAGDEIELKGEIVSGHVVNVFAGTDGVGGISSDIYGRIKTLGSEVHLTAGSLGGDIVLTDLFIETAGPFEILAPAGSITNTGGLLQAGSLKVFARDGADLGFVEVGAVDAEVTGAGGIKLYAFGSISLDRLVTANGPIDITGTGNVEFGNVLPGGPNGTLRVDPLTTVSGNVPFADPLYLNVAGGTTITTATSELHLNVVSPGNVTVHHTGDGALTVYATVANGSLTIDTGGDLIIIDVEVLTNLDGRELTLVAGGDVIVGRIVAGAYAATAADSAAIRTTLGLAEDTLLTSLTSVSIQAGGAIRQLAAGDPDVDIIAGSLTLKAGTGIPGLELAVNQLTEVTTTTGPITLTDVDSVGEISQGLDVVQVRANEGTVTITAAGSLLVGSVTAGGALHLTSSAGGFELRDHDPLPAALSSTGITSIHAGAQVFLTGPVTTGGLVVDAQGAVQITQAIAAAGSVSIVSHHSHLVLGADIQVRANGILDELLLAAQGNLNLAGRTLPTVTSRLSLTAGAEMIFSLAQPALIVTGANGELTITAGGDLVFLSETLLQADHLALASTGYIDADGTAHGGHLWVIGSPRGATSPTPRTVSLAATNGLHLHQGVTAAEVLRLAGGEVSLSRTGSLRLFEELAIANGVNDPTVLAAVAGSVGFLSAPTIEIAGGTTLRFDQGTHFEDQLRTTHPIVLLDGIIVLDVSASADETTAITPGAALPLTFTGSGGLTKRGAGTFELATTNTFTGPLQVEGGTLLLTGSTSASTSVTVTNATLAGTGTLVGPLTIGNGGHLIVGTAPNQIATFRTGALVFQTGSHLYLDLNATQRDALIVTGSITIHHDAAVTVIGLDGFVMPEAYTRYTLVHNDTSADAVIGRFQHITTRNDLGVELIAGILHTGGDGNDLDLESGLDYGDAPAGYPVLLADNGARHVILGPKLGNLCNVESEGAPSASASSDPGDDGVTFLTTLVSSAVSPTVASLTVDLENAGASNLLDAWIDFNQDGDWDDVGEQIFASVALGTTSGRTTLSFTLPAGASVGTTFARFRLSSAGHLLPTGFASDGEVEDYQVTIVPSGSPASVTLPSGGTTTVDVASGQLRVRQHGITLFQAPAPAVGALAVHGSDADDNTLALDFSTGNPVPAGGITFHGGTGGNDALVLLRGASTGLFDTITHTFTSPTSGSAALDPDGPNGAAASWISYSGVEGASDSLDALHRALQFAGGDESITLADASGASMTVRSTAGTPLTFANPASHLTLDAGDGDDSVTILSLDTDGPFDAGLTLEGGEGSDAIRLEAALTPAAHHSVAFTAESIAVLAPIATTGSSSIHLLAGQALTLGASLSASADVTLAATTGSITGAGNDGVDVQANSLSADAATGIDLNTQVTSLTATTRGAGSITIDEADALVLTDVTAANGAIRITTGGALVVGKVASTTDQDDNAIVLQARTGNVTVGTINTTPHLHGDVRVEALQGAILDDQSDATGILADELFLAAMLGLGEAAVSGQLDFDAVKLITHTEGGNAHQYLGEANDVAFLRGDAGAGTLYLVNGTYRLGAGDDNLANASGVHLASQVALELQDESEAIGSLAGEIGATLRLGLGTLTTGASNASTTFAGTITGSGGITKVGAGIFTLTGANTYAGLTTLKEGTLSVRTSANLGNGSATNDLVFQGGTLRTTGSFTTGREVKLSAPGATLDTAAGTSLALTGLITGSGTLTKTGAGTLVLVGNNRHAGPTTITAGQLQVNGRSSLGTLTTATASVKRGASLINHGTIRGNVHVDAGATLRGRGRILGNTIVRGNLRPGDASRPGVLTLGANSGKQLHLSGTAHFRINGAQHDSITTNARVTLSGRLLLTFGAAPVAGAQITMIRNQSQRPILGTFQGLPEGAILTIGPARVQITYRGGASQRDVVLRVLTGRRINR
ncbi:MAG: autotransporter-associated beta strand repeat-containing protein [Gemmataceae bacterium]